MSQWKRTPIFPLYADFAAVKCIPFGGWEMPVQFVSIQKEHEAVRSHAGLFDVSHMGEVMVTGPKAEAYLQHMTTNDVERLEDGAAQYSLLCYPDGGVVDDLLVYRLAKDEFMLVINASNIEKDWAWLNEHAAAFPEVSLKEVSESTALLALQGPKAADILSRVTSYPIDSLKSFQFARDVSVCEVPALVSRTGYTGEDGFELYTASQDAPALWQALLAAGSGDGLLPAGLGARDTLRFEARLPLYGQELSAAISPLEAGLQPFVKLDKGEFIGRSALLEQKQAGLKRKLVGIELLDRGIPRCGYSVYAGSAAPDASPVGAVTTGTLSPTLGRAIGLALVDAEHAGLGQALWVEIRGKRLQARVVPTPFYKRPKR
ncbi:glycine cleavage system aminomethyltransferase GcvT [Paenibacillus cremeus]|uniref:Aminomethyltransferase n=1 Tax=Paenibacillus cremeus TaxID=2163881 RepID=A0A559K4L3_9BACL|nr:glycine cleavage system aminomethyltransferase GcvT [Paenibacillus cremeus]TVY07088.1 glycine cleavage system aminomethyltransferase GcvT [Paenibacillus cremeus]